MVLEGRECRRSSALAHTGEGDRDAWHANEGKGGSTGLQPGEMDGPPHWALALVEADRG